jgi:hypothetical protein
MEMRRRMVQTGDQPGQHGPQPWAGALVMCPHGNLIALLLTAGKLVEIISAIIILELL